jgi:hypothetical protein
MAASLSFKLLFIVAIGTAAYGLRWALGLPAVKYASRPSWGLHSLLLRNSASRRLRLIRGRQVSQADPPASGPYFSGLALTTIMAGAYALVALL